MSKSEKKLAAIQERANSLMTSTLQRDIAPDDDLNKQQLVVSIKSDQVVITLEDKQPLLTRQEAIVTIDTVRYADICRVIGETLVFEYD